MASDHRGAIDAADGMSTSNEARHDFVATKARAAGVPLHDSQLDTVISGLVAAKRRPDVVTVLSEESVG